jgi:hypothetical protein
VLSPYSHSARNIKSSASVGTPVFDAERDRRLIIILGV